MGRLKGGYLGGSTILKKAWFGGPKPEMTAEQRQQEGETKEERAKRLQSDTDLQKAMQENDRRLAKSKGNYGARTLAKAKRKKWKRPKPRTPQILEDKLAREKSKILNGNPESGS